MFYELEFSEQADLDIAKHKKAGNKAVLNKIFAFIDELYEHPFTGTGKPEALKYELVGRWSRRINKEHRLIYKVEEQTVFILSVYGHYS
jgi:toxin YoeB